MCLSSHLDCFGLVVGRVHIVICARLALSMASTHAFSMVATPISQNRCCLQLMGSANVSVCLEQGRGACEPRLTRRQQLLVICNRAVRITHTIVSLKISQSRPFLSHRESIAKLAVKRAFSEESYGIHVAGCMHDYSVSTLGLDSSSLLTVLVKSRLVSQGRGRRQSLIGLIECSHEKLQV